MTESQQTSSLPASEATLERAAHILRAGGVVAFPTETVYGLGANAEDAAAVRRVYAIKGRPPGHPVIVHLADASQLDDWAREVPESARILARTFWPGPLTLVLPRTSRAADDVTGGQDTVALRVPSHEVARAILQRAAVGVIAPSANRFGTPSATKAEHVVADFGTQIDLVVDAGPATVGIESTIVDCAHGTPAILRPGGIPREALERALGAPLRDASHSAVRAPGRLPSHYAPTARVELFEDSGSAHRRLQELHDEGVSAALVGDESAVELAHDLYDRLRAADRAGTRVIVAILPSDAGLGAALRDRLVRAAAPKSSTCA